MVILQSGIAFHMYIKKINIFIFFLSLTQISSNCVRLNEEKTKLIK